MTNPTPTLYRLTPIDDVEGLAEGRYIVKNDYGMFEVSFDNKYQFNEEFTDCSDLTHYLKPLPPGTQILEPGMVAVSEDDIQNSNKVIEYLLEHINDLAVCDIGMQAIEYNNHLLTKLTQMGDK